MNIKKTILSFIELTRAYALGVTFASCFVIYGWAKSVGTFTYFNYFLLVFALCCLHLGANLYDDFIDIKNKLKTGISLQDVHFNTLEIKARLIKDGTYSLKQVQIIIAMLFLISTLIGIYFAFVSGWQVLLFALAGAILTLFYPISSKYCLAEVSIGLIYGPLMILGGYFALCAKLDSSLFTLSIAIMLATIILLHVHNLMDYEYDIKENKNTIPILLKDKSLSVFVLKFMFISAYAIILIGIIIGIFPITLLLVLLTLPMAITLTKSMRDYINIKDVQFIPHWYLGPFENWKKIAEQNIDFFMYRFYLARNFSFFFALFISIGAIITKIK